MVGRIQGITIEIGGDGSGLEKALKGVDKSIKTTQGNLRDINKLLKLDPGNTELLTQKQKNLEKSIDLTNKRLEELKKAQGGVAEGSEKWDGLQREIIATEQNLQKLEDEYRNFGSVTAQQVAAAGQSMQELGGKIEGVGQKLQPLSTAATGALGGLAAMAYSAITNSDDLNTLAKQTGLTTAEIQKMQFAADRIDVSFSDIEGALKKMKGKMDPANATFQHLGVSVTNADDSLRDASEVFYESIAALSQIENETERDQVAMDLFGKSADNLAGIIDDGGAALEQYGKEAEEMGLILDQETLDSLNTLNDTIDALKANFAGAFGKLGSTLATTFGPALEKVAEKAQLLADKIANLNPETAETIVKVLGVVAAIGPLLTGVGKLTKGVGAALKLAPKIVSGVKLIAGVMNPTTLGIALVVAAVVAAVKIWQKYGDQITGYVKSTVSKIKGQFENMKSSIAKTNDAIKAQTAAVWGEMQTMLQGKWNNIKSAYETHGGGLKGIAAATMQGIKEYYTLGFDALNTLLGGKLTGLKNAFSAAWSDIKSTVSNVIQNIKNTVSGMNLKLPEIQLPSWETIKTKLNDIIQKIKDLFKWDWKLPDIKLPHFKISGGVSPYGLGGKGSLPSISIDWYKRAYQNPVMFTNPTVLATQAGYKGFGDGHGAEIVMGLNKLRELVGTSQGDVTINVYGTPGMNTDELARAVEQKLVALQKRRNAVYA